MFTLVARYLADPSQVNARRLVNYLAKHPMAECYADRLEAALIAQARASV